MGKFSFDQMMKHKTGGGNSFFRLKNNEEAKVRFLYNSFPDIEGYTVHEFNTNGNYATILCGRSEDDSKLSCKWCAMNNTPVNRVVLAMYNEDTQEIQYWKRSEQWVKDTLVPQLEEVVNQNQPIASQVFKIKRKGDGLDTVYSLIMLGAPDGKSKEAFGEVTDPFTLNIIRSTDYDFDPLAQQNQNNYNQGNYNNQPNNNYNNPQNYNNQPNYNNQNNQYYNPNMQSTRRTNEIF